MRFGSLGALVLVAGLGSVGCVQDDPATVSTTGDQQAEVADPAPGAGGWESTDVEGPVSAGTHAMASASCPSGWAVAGGFLVDRSDGAPPSPSIRVVSSVPADKGGGAPPDRWDAVGATGGQDEVLGRTRSWVRCDELSQPELVEATANGPTDPGSSADAVARCPRGRVLLGGGGGVAMGDGSKVPRHYFLSGSYPSDRSGGVAASGGVADAWTVVGSLGGSPAEGGIVRAIAVCGEGAPASVVVARQEGPASPRTGLEVSASCGHGAAVLSGGAIVDLSGGGSPPQGVHLRGSRPDASPDDPVVSRWTATANSGGQVALGARTTSVVLCRAPG